MTKKNRESMVEKFHKSAVHMAEKLVGESAENFSTFPFVAKNENGYALYLPGVDSQNADYDFLHPYVVSAGLSLELKIKYLYFIESGKELRGHNLLNLYKSLTKESTEYISYHIKEKTNDSEAHRAIKDFAKTRLDINLDWDSIFLLEKSSFAFEKWRYLYEADNAGSWFVGYIELYDAVGARIQVARFGRG